MKSPDIHAAVEEAYAKAARGVREASADNPLASELYDEADHALLPSDALAAAAGCANPAALADLRAGETVLDLGSGGGIDVLLAARRVGPGGFVYGLDMTAAMVELAERNRREAGVENARFLEGRIEQIPLNDESVDVVLSNCVMNLSPDKPAVLAEAHRVLRPGGRLAIADLATRGELPPAMREGLAAWSACFAGALEVDELQALLIAAGFEDAGVEITRTFGPADLDLLPATLLAELGIENLPVDQLAAAASRVVSVFLRGRKAAP